MFYEGSKKMECFIKKVIAVIVLLVITVFLYSGCTKTFKPISSYFTTQNPTPKGTVDASKQNPEFDFTDVNLEEVVRDQLNKSVGPIYLSEIQSIVKIRARVCSIRSINDLKYFTSLEELDLYGNRISDITPLGGLTKLKILNLSKNYSINSKTKDAPGMQIECLNKITSLEELYLDYNAISNVGNLSRLVKLKTLSLNHNNLTDISLLSELTKLTYLDVNNNVKIEANLKETGISDISVIKNMPNLEYLDISNNIIMDASNVNDCVKLKHLYVSYNLITDLNYLEYNNSVEELSANNNFITSFNFILKMPALKQLKYEGNPISEYGAIDKMFPQIENTPN